MKTLLALGGFVTGCLLAPGLAPAATFYVNTATGDDTRSCLEAQNPSTPKKTIGTPAPVNATGGLLCAFGGDTVEVAPGTYAEKVESKRDGAAASPIVIRSTTPLGAIVQPPAGERGFSFSHNYITVDGFKITGGNKGVQVDDHDVTAAPVVGVLIQNNEIYGNTLQGIQVKNGLNIEIAFNSIHNNASHGVVYTGNTSVIHDNLITNNGGFGIYVKNGVDHQVYDNSVSGNVSGNLQILGTTVASPEATYYVDCASGNDAYTPTQAKNVLTPWRTVKQALGTADAGDTVMVLPGVCNETTIESKRDGASGKPIVIRALTPGTVTIDPPSGNGIFISHNYHSLQGLVFTGAVVGVQVGPHQVADGTVSGVVINECVVFGNTNIGVKFTNAVGGVVKHSVVRNNNKEGIRYAGTGAKIVNNLVHSNGLGGGGEYGISIASGNNHSVTSNTIYGNVSGGLRLSESEQVPVFGSALNNIIAANPVGVKEPAGAGYTGSFTLDYNDVFGNTTSNYSLSKSVVGPNSISADPRFVDTVGFQLGRQATGQAVNSPCIDAGSASAESLNLGGRTAFTDKSPDTGAVDLGYHGTELVPTEGSVTVSLASITFNAGAGNDSFNLSLKLAPGAGSDGIAAGTNYAEVTFGAFLYSLPVSGFSGGPDVWTFTGSGALSTGTFTKQADGSVDVTVQASGLNLSYSDSPIVIGIRIGDDFGSSQVGLKGTISYP